MSRNDRFCACALVLWLLLIALLLFGAAGTAPRCLTVTLTPGHVARTVDGDTYDGYNTDDMSGYVRIRVLGVDTPERGDSLYYEARDSTAAWLARGSYRSHSCARDSFGRLLAWTTRGTDSLHVYLVRLQLGVRR